MYNSEFNKAREEFGLMMWVSEVGRYTGLGESEVREVLKSEGVPILSGERAKTIDVVRCFMGEKRDVDYGQVIEEEIEVDELSDKDWEEIKELEVSEGVAYYSEGREGWGVIFSIGHSEKGIRRRRLVVGENKEEVSRKYFKYKGNMNGIILPEEENGRVIEDRLYMVDLLERWADYERGKIERKMSDALARSTLKGYESMMRYRLIDFFSSRKTLVVEVNNSLIRELMYFIESEGGKVKDVTVRAYLIPISKAFQYGEEMGIVRENLVKNYKYKGRGLTMKDRRDRVKDEKMGEFLNNMKGHPFEIIYHITLVYALRRGEVMGLKWENIDFNREMITICRTRTGGGKYREDKNRTKGREVQSYIMSKELKDRLLIHQKEQEENIAKYGVREGDEGFVSGVKMKTLDEVRVPCGNYLSKVYKVEMEKIGVTSRFHEIRHTAASKVYEMTKDLKVTQNYLRHKDSKVTEVYIHGSEERVKEATDVAGDFYNELTGGLEEESNREESSVVEDEDSGLNLDVKDYYSKIAVGLQDD